MYTERDRVHPGAKKTQPSVKKTGTIEANTYWKKISSSFFFVEPDILNVL